MHTRHQHRPARRLRAGVTHTPSRAPGAAQLARLVLVLALVAVAVVAPLAGSPVPVAHAAGYWLATGEEFSFSGSAAFTGYYGEHTLTATLKGYKVVVTGNISNWSRTGYCQDNSLACNDHWIRPSENRATGTFCIVIDAADVTAGCDVLVPGATDLTGAQSSYLDGFGRSAGRVHRAGILQFDCAPTCSGTYTFTPIYFGDPTATPTATSTASSTPTPTATATSTPTPTGTNAPFSITTTDNFCDGDLELSTVLVLQGRCWSIFPETNSIGRLGTSTGPFAPACGRQYQALGGWFSPDPSRMLYPFSTHQRFSWPGGIIRIRWEARGDPVSGVGYLDSRIVHIDTGEAWELSANAEYASGQWETHTNSFTAPAGEYQISFSLGASSFNHSTASGRFETVFIDNVWVGSQSLSHCSSDAMPATATRTRTPIVTRTPTATGPTPTASRTPTVGPTATAGIISFANCGFESGSAGWVGQGFNIALAGGPNGPQYANLQNSTATIGRTFSWTSAGFAYFQFWVGPNSYGELNVLNTSSGTRLIVWTGNNASGDWVKYRASRQLPAATYRMEFRSYNTMKIDGVTVSRNTYANCSPDPTPGPTPFITGTPTRTATAGPSPTRTRTAIPSATRTPNNTLTPAPPPATTTASATVTASHTPANDGTATSSAATATSAAATQNSDNATGTAAAPATSAAATQNSEQATQNAAPPPQPEPAPQADCDRPTSALNIPAWIDYEVCRVLTWTLWNDENTAQAQEIEGMFAEYEPIGTLNEMQQARETISTVLDSYDWDATGYGADGVNPDLTMFVPDGAPEGILTGELDLSPGAQPGGFAFVTVCNLHMASVFGDAMAMGVCASINWLRDVGILGWAQYLFDIVVWLAFVRYGWYFVTEVIPTIL